MPGRVVIQPMSEKFILWRCLHFGPLLLETIDRFPSYSEVDWEYCRSRNIPLLLKLTRIYGSCAILAQVEDRVIGQLRFYPKVVCDMKGAGGLCLLQKHPNGPTDDFSASDFPPLDQIEDKSLRVHCLMTGSSQQKRNPYQRIGIGSLMVKELVRWAKSKGWRSIEADAFEDIPLIYQITGSAGQTFWKKLGFHVAERYPHPYLQKPSEFLEQLEDQACSMGISPEKASDKIVMRIIL